MSAADSTPSNRLASTIDPASAEFRQNAAEMAALVRDIRRQEDVIALGGGPDAIERQHAKGRLTARERIRELLDPGAPFFELSLYAAHGMYEEWDGAPAAGVVTGLGDVAGRLRAALEAPQPNPGADR
jgi:acetyl-CoA carboxylase carboxyltransferase component